MPIRNSPLAIKDLSDLNRLDELVVDKRLGKRASAKKIGVIATTKNSLFATVLHII
jgi:hypothetical protein